MKSTPKKTAKKRAAKSKTPVSKGWECPRCAKIHAPGVMGCDCEKKKPDYGETTDVRWKLIKEFEERRREADKYTPIQPPIEWPPRHVPRPHYEGPIWVIPYHPHWNPMEVTCNTEGMYR